MIERAVPIVLASSSSTRRELLSRIVEDFEVVPPRVDEASFRTREPRRLARDLARAKARHVARKRPGALVIGADTVVACEGEIIGKPADRADAVRILDRLADHSQEVITGLCVIAPDGRELLACVSATVQLRPMERAELEALADRPGALQKAGAYALEPDDPNVIHLEGSVTAVMGLPLEQLGRMLAELLPSP